MNFDKFGRMSEEESQKLRESKEFYLVWHGASVLILCGSFLNEISLSNHPLATGNNRPTTKLPKEDENTISEGEKKD